MAVILCVRLLLKAIATVNENYLLALIPHECKQRFSVLSKVCLSHLLFSSAWAFHRWEAFRLLYKETMNYFKSKFLVHGNSHLK